MRAGEWDASVGGGDRRRDREKEEEGTGVLQAAQEAVAKALGGGSRGMFPFLVFGGGGKRSRSLISVGTS
jgi:hypothetical protein